MDRLNPVYEPSLSQKYESYVKASYSRDTSAKAENALDSQRNSQKIYSDSQRQQNVSSNREQPQKIASELTSGRNTLQLDDGSSVFDSSRKPLSPHNQLSSYFKAELNQAIQEFAPYKEDKTSNVVIYQDIRSPNSQNIRSPIGMHRSSAEYDDQPVSTHPRKNPTSKSKKREIRTSNDDITLEESGIHTPSVFFRNEPSKSTIPRSGSNAMKSFQSPNKWSPTAKSSNITKSFMRFESDKKESELDNLEDKYRRLQCKAREMRKLLREYALKCSDIEELLDERTEQLQASQNNLKRVQLEHLKHFESLHKYAEKEEEWAKTEQQLRAVLQEFSLSEQQQKKRFEELEALINFNEQKYVAQVQALEAEKQRIYGDMQARDQIMNEQTRVLETLQNELNALRSEKKLRTDQYKELENSNLLKDEEIKRLKDQLADAEVRMKEIEQLKTAKSHVEEKVGRLKHKLAEERERFSQESNEILAERKEKIKSLKSELKRVMEEKKNLELQFEREKNASVELANLRKEVENLQHQNKELKAENENLKVQNDDIFRRQQKEYEKAVQLQSELQKKSKELKKASERADASEKNLAMVEEIMAQLKLEINLLIEENTKGRDYIFQLETNLTSANSRYEDASKELRELKGENEKVKQINRVFQHDLDMLGKKVTEMQAQEKLKALNDIQDLIHSYRLSHTQSHN